MSLANGYSFKEIPIVLHDQAFADDISLISSSPALAQKTINLIDTFLVWFRLQANPKKCIAMAMKKFDPRFVPKIHYERYGSTTALTTPS